MLAETPIEASATVLKLHTVQILEWQQNGLSIDEVASRLTLADGEVAKKELSVKKWMRYVYACVTTSYDDEHPEIENWVAREADIASNVVGILRDKFGDATTTDLLHGNKLIASHERVTKLRKAQLDNWIARELNPDQVRGLIDPATLDTYTKRDLLVNYGAYYKAQVKERNRDSNLEHLSDIDE